MFWTLLIFCAIQRIFEVFLSKRHQQKLAGLAFESRESSSALWIMIFMHSGWFVSMVVESLVHPRVFSKSSTLLFILIFAMAQMLRVWTIKTLGYHWNISVWAPQNNEAGPQTLFVTDGPYKFIRHPNYLAVILEFASLPLAGGAIWTASIFSLLNLILLKRRIKREEDALFSRSGYREAMGSKARFLPGLI